MAVITSTWFILAECIVCSPRGLQLSTTYGPSTDTGPVPIRQMDAAQLSDLLGPTVSPSAHSLGCRPSTFSSCSATFKFFLPFVLTRFYEYIYLYQNSVMFQIEQKTKVCSKIALTEAWDPFDIPQNSTFEDQYIVGGPGDNVEVQEWSDRKPARKRKSSSACFKVSTQCSDGRRGLWTEKCQDFKM